MRIGTSRMHTLLRPPHPLPNLPPAPLAAAALTLPLCLDGRKEALRVGNGLHQTLRGSERMTGIQRESGEGEEKQGGGSACVVGRWGSEEAGGCKLIIDHSVGMLESVSLIRSVNSVHVKFTTLPI